MLPNDPGFETNVTPELIEAIRSFVYSNVTKDCDPYRSSTVCVSRITTSKEGDVNASPPKTWECHNIIKESWSTGGTAIFSQRQKSLLKQSDKWADYYVNRSPYAPFIWSTAEEYQKHGIIASSDVPANFMASLMIGSRNINSGVFLDSFNVFLGLGLPEDLSCLLAHWFRVSDKTLYLGHAVGHGLFNSANSNHPCVFWSWLRRQPAFVADHQFSEDTEDSTYGGVYALWDGWSASDFSWNGKRRNSVDFKLAKKFNEYLERLRNPPRQVTDFNPFKKSLEVEQAKLKKTQTSESWTWNNETKEAFTSFFKEIEAAALSLDEPSFINYWKER